MKKTGLNFDIKIQIRTIFDTAKYLNNVKNSIARISKLYCLICDLINKIRIQNIHFDYDHDHSYKNLTSNNVYITLGMLFEILA